MQVILYRFAIQLYSAGIRIASLFNEKAKLFRNGRSNWRQQIEKANLGDRNTIWFHCASLGEFEQGRPLIERIKEVYPDHKIVLTFFSPSGYEVRKGYSQADLVCYLPMDSERNAIDFIEAIRPDAAFFIKYEYWFFYLRRLAELKIPAYVASAIFRENHIFFKWYGSMHRKMLGMIRWFFVQDEDSKQLLESIGYKNITVSGDTRFDRVVSNATTADDHAIINALHATAPLLVAGSTWPKDEKLLASLPDYEKGKLKLIIAPHEVSETSIQRVESIFGSGTVRYSNWDGEPEHVRCLIVDSIGKLSAIYRHGDINYVGGGFGSGIHNTLEAAVFGAPVLFGPNHKKFKEARDLVNLSGAFVVHDAKEMQSIISMILGSAERIQEIATTNKAYLQNNAGATQQILDALIRRGV